MAELKLEDWFPMSPLIGPPLPAFLNIYWPWYTPPAAGFSVSNLVISPAEVNPGQVVAISCLVTNTGAEAGSYTVKLGGDFMAEQSVTLQPGESKVIAFEVIPQKEKTYQVLVDGLSGSFKAIGIPDIRLGNLRFEPISPKAGDIVYTYVTAKNYGTATGSRAIEFRVTPPQGIAQWETRTVTLAPGESITISSRFYTALEGTHYVSVDGLTGSFTCAGILNQVWIGIYDEQTGYPVAGNIWVDGIWYTTERTLSLKSGDHAFVVAVPSGYKFLRCEIYDSNTSALITSESVKGFWLMVDRSMSVQAFVQPL